MANKYHDNNDAAEYYEDPGDPNYLGKLQSNKKPQENYPGKAKDGGEDIGLAEANNSEDFGLTPQSDSISKPTSKKHGGYEPNNAS